LYPIKSIEGHPKGPSRVVAFNPKNAMIATAGNELVSPLLSRITLLIKLMP